MLLIRLLDRLIAGQVLGALLLAWAVLVGLDLVLYTTGQLLRLERSGLGLGELAAHVAWTLPRRGYELFPSAALLGCVLGLGQLASRSELVAMRAAGLSKLRIAAGALGAILALLAVVVVLGETVAASAERRAQSVLLRARGGGLELLGGGLWAREGRDFLHAQAAMLEGENAVRLRAVRLFRLDERGRLQELWLADSALYRDGDWTWFELRRLHFGDGRLVEERLARASWESELDPGLLRLGAIRPRYMPVAELAAQIGYFERNELDAGEYLVAYWGRVLYPLNVLAMCLCGLPFAFTSPRGAGFGRNLFFGVVLGIGFWLLQRALANLAQVYGLELAVASALPGLAFAAAGILWLGRSR